MAGIIVTIPPAVELPPGSNSSNPATLPPVTYTYAVLNLPQTWTAKQTFPLGMISAQAADIVGSLTSIPAPTISTLGGVFSKAVTSHQFLTQIGTDGTPAAAQPAFSDISGQATLAQLPTLGANTILGSIAGGTPIALSTAQHTSLVNAFTTTLNGAVPNPGTVASKFLRDDGTWQAVSGATAGLAIAMAIIFG